MKIRITLLLKEKCILLALLYVFKQKCTTYNYNHLVERHTEQVFCYYFFFKPVHLCTDLSVIDPTP